MKIAVVDDDGVRTLSVSNPPVNALSHEVRVALIEALDSADEDPTVSAVVISTGGKTFFSGADIRELESPVSPRVFDLTRCIESMSKPVVAALKGAALGGGLEVACACHARVALTGTKLGFPEVKLGLIPGAGGTQYAARLIGPVKAVRLVSKGDLILADGEESSLIDLVVDNDVDGYARDHASRLASGEPQTTRVRDRSVPAYDAAEYDAAVRSILKRAGQQTAVVSAIEAVNAAIQLGFDEGTAKERQLFEALRTGEQSKALRYQFFAERVAAKIQGVSHDTPAKPVNSIGIVGGGTMGRGIALAFLSAGYDVTLVDSDSSVAEAAAKAIATTLRRDHERGRLNSDQLADAQARCNVLTGDASLIGDVDLAIEAAFEDMAVKEEIFRILDQSLPKGAILATNTSSLDVNKIGQATDRPELVVGMHFFSPANVMRLLEVVRTDHTSPETLASVLVVAKRLRKTAVVVGVCDGFVGNRMLAQRHIAAERLLIEGALPEQVDRAWVAFGFPMGVFAMTDLAGVDVNWRVRKARGTELPIHDAIYEMGRYGQKTGSGFFRYRDGQRTPESDPEIESLIVKTSARMGIARRVISDKEIVERLVYPMINEGARLIEEGIAQRASDVDVVWVNGYGWPGWRGGPMYYADTIGIGTVCETLLRLRSETADARLEPAPLLRRLAESGGRFTDHNSQSA